MLFDWNKEKALTNLRNHKVSFQEAATVFKNSLSETFDDPDHSIDDKDLLLGIRKLANYFSYHIQMTAKL